MSHFSRGPSAWILFFFLLSSAAQAKVLLIKQWHLSSNVKTLDIQAAKNLDQYRNQKAIYVYLKNRIKQEKVAAVVGEGFEGEVTPRFDKNFQGWTYKRLQSKNSSPLYADILTHVPLKLEVRFKDKVETIGGDSDKLVQLHEQILGHLSRYTGLYIKLKQTKGRDAKSYAMFKQKLLEGVDIIASRVDAVEYAREQALEAVAVEKKIFDARNDFFMNRLLKLNKKYPKKEIALVIGQRHVPDLKNRLEAAEIEVEVVELPGLPKDSGNEMERLKAILKST